jgi:hypothetical protein
MAWLAVNVPFASLSLSSLFFAASVACSVEFGFASSEKSHLQKYCLQ